MIYIHTKVSKLKDTIQINLNAPSVSEKGRIEKPDDKFENKQSYNYKIKPIHSHKLFRSVMINNNSQKVLCSKTHFKTIKDKSIKWITNLEVCITIISLRLRTQTKPLIWHLDKLPHRFTRTRTIKWWINRKVFNLSNKWEWCNNNNIITICKEGSNLVSSRISNFNQCQINNFRPYQGNNFKRCLRSLKTGYNRTNRTKWTNWTTTTLTPTWFNTRTKWAILWCRKSYMTKLRSKRSTKVINLWSGLLSGNSHNYHSLTSTEPLGTILWTQTLRFRSLSTNSSRTKRAKRASPWSISRVKT